MWTERTAGVVAIYRANELIDLGVHFKFERGSAEEKSAKVLEWVVFRHFAMEQSRERSESRDGRSISTGGSRVPLVRAPPVLPTNPVPTISPSPRPANRLARLPPLVAHFLGYRPPRIPSPTSNDSSEKSTKPILVLPFLARIPLRLEISILDFIGGFFSILLACAYTFGASLSRGGILSPNSIPLAMGSLGATAVLLYALPESPLSTPRNVIGGHFISALIGISVGLRSSFFAIVDVFARIMRVLTAHTISRRSRSCSPFRQIMRL